MLSYELYMNKDKRKNFCIFCKHHWNPCGIFNEPFLCKPNSNHFVYWPGTFCGLQIRYSEMLEFGLEI